MTATPTPPAAAAADWLAGPGDAEALPMTGRAETETEGDRLGVGVLLRERLGLTLGLADAGAAAAESVLVAASPDWDGEFVWLGVAVGVRPVVTVCVGVGVWLGVAVGVKPCVTDRVREGGGDTVALAVPVPDGVDESAAATAVSTTSEAEDTRIPAAYVKCHKVPQSCPVTASNVEGSASVQLPPPVALLDQYSASDVLPPAASVWPPTPQP